MSAQETLAALAASENNVAAGIAECLQALSQMTNAAAASGPILIEFGPRTIALGRKRMGSMTGKNAFVVLKGKFGLLNATTPLYLQACFAGQINKWIELDLESWEELVPYMQKLRIVT